MVCCHRAAYPQTLQGCCGGIKLQTGDLGVGDDRCADGNLFQNPQITAHAQHMAVLAGEGVEAVQLSQLNIYTADADAAALGQAGVWAVGDVQGAEPGCGLRAAVPEGTICFDEGLLQSDIAKCDICGHEVIVFLFGQTKLQASPDLVFSCAEAKVERQFRTGNDCHIFALFVHFNFGFDCSTDVQTSGGNRGCDDQGCN